MYKAATTSWVKPKYFRYISLYKCLPVHTYSDSFYFRSYGILLCFSTLFLDNIKHPFSINIGVR